MWFSVVCTLIYNDIRHRIGQNLLSIAWHINVSSIFWILIYNGKLANQIARLVAILKKKQWLECVRRWLANQIARLVAIVRKKNSG